MEDPHWGQGESPGIEIVGQVPQNLLIFCKLLQDLEEAVPGFDRDSTTANITVLIFFVSELGTLSRCKLYMLA